MYTHTCTLKVLAGNRSPGTSRIPAPGASNLRRPSAGAGGSSPKQKPSKLKSSGRSPPSQKNEKAAAAPNKGQQQPVKPSAQVSSVRLWYTSNIP